MQELRRRLRAAAALWPSYADGVGFLVGDFNICDPDEGRVTSRNWTFSEGDTVAPLSSLPPSRALWKSLSPTSRARMRGVTALSTRFHVLIAFSSIFLW